MHRRLTVSIIAVSIMAALVVGTGGTPAGAASPSGALDRVDRTASGIVVHGWALDADRAGVAVPVHVYVDGELVAAGSTGRARADVAAASPGASPNSGYAVAVDGVFDWNAELCVWALDDGAEGSHRLGCMPPLPTYAPIGALDRVDVRPDGLVVWGWAADGDALAEGPPVHVYTDGVLTGTGTTGVERPDVAAVFGALGTTTGFGIVVPDPGDGRHQVCAWAVDVGGGASVRLGCRWTGVPDDLLATTRVIAHYGSGVTPRLGIAGEGTPAQAAALVAAVADDWADLGTPTVPAFDYIATVATSWPGPDGDYSNPGDLATIRTYLDAIRGVGGILVLDLQPGSTDFAAQARLFEELLLEPDVGLALDPEWRMPPGVVPGTRIGSVDIAEVNEVSAYLAALVRDHGLPQKLFMVHQFTPSMIRDRDQMVAHPELATVIQLDGFGGRAVKIAKYDELHPEPPFHSGFKLFIDEDTNLMGPADVDAALDPNPAFVSYQ